MRITWSQRYWCIAMIVFLGVSQLAIANTGEPYNYYEPAPLHLLDKIEEYHLPQAITQLNKGEYEFAWGEFSFVLHYFPNHPRALQLMSDLSLTIDYPDRASALFDRAIRLYPKTASTYQIYGAFLRKINQLEDAAKQYEQALLLETPSPDLYYNLGLIYLALQRFEQANEKAQLAYNQGYPLVALREQLIENGAWAAQ